MIKNNSKLIVCAYKECMKNEIQLFFFFFYYNTINL